MVGTFSPPYLSESRQQIMAATDDRTQQITYGHAPITEAVIHLRTSRVVSETEQKKVVRRLKALYPHSQPQQSININLTATGGPNVAVEQQLHGFRLTSDDETDIVLILHDGIVISRLAPTQVGRNSENALQLCGLSGRRRLRIIQ